MSDTDEFRFFQDQAAEHGLAQAPQLGRVELTPAVSALTWGVEPATVVFLHGAALNAHTWDEVGLSLIEAGDPGRFLAIDLPGHGDSAWRADASYAPHLLAGEVSVALSAARTAGLLAEHFAVVGQSLGGLVGLFLAGAAEPGLESLILVDILPLRPEAGSAVAAFLSGPASFASREEIVERALGFGLGGSRTSLERGVWLNTRPTAEGRVEWKHHLGQLGGAGLPLSDLAGLWQVIETSQVPMALVVATASIVVQADVDRFAVLRPQSQPIRLPGGHNLQEDSPAELAQVLAGLLGTS